MLNQKIQINFHGHFNFMYKIRLFNKFSLSFKKNSVDVNILTNPTTINTSEQPILDIPRVIINQDDDSDVLKDIPPPSLFVDNMKNRSEDSNSEKITVAPSLPKGLFMVLTFVHKFNLGLRPS